MCLVFMHAYFIQKWSKDIIIQEKLYQHAIFPFEIQNGHPAMSGYFYQHGVCNMEIEWVRGEH